MKLWSLQALRFWAAFGVCWFHAVGMVDAVFGPTSIPDVLARAGQAGVDVFFILSGLIITLTSPGLTPALFLAKRARRILPLWWLVSVPTLTVIWLQHGGLDWRTLAATLTLWPAWDVMRAPVGVGWTLSFEAMFYAAAALVLWRRWMVVPLVSVWVVAGLFPIGPALQFIGNPLVAEFLLGVLIAKLPTWRPASLLIPVGVLLILLGAPNVGVDENGTQMLVGAQGWGRVLYMGLPAALVVFGARQLAGGEGVFARLGDASYALYLLHPPLQIFLFAALALVPGVPGAAALAFVLAVCVWLSWRLHELVEKPILAFFGRRSTPAVA